MRKLACLGPVALAILLAGCSGSPAGPDAGQAGPDAGLAGADATGAPDAASAGADVGGEPAGPDAGGTAEADVGTPLPEDAGAEPGEDAGSSSEDAGAGEPDGGADELFGRPRSPLFGSLVFNEVLTDGTTDGDPNQDGDADPVEDQFAELVNASAAAVAMGGFTLVDQDFPGLPRHTFVQDFSLPPGHAVVVFGGGDAPDPTATATFFSANAADPGLQFGLHLMTPADHLLLLDADGKVVAFFCYGGAPPDCGLQAASDQSLTRSPDVTGDFVPHTTAPGANGAAFSVGTRADGTAF